MTRKVKAREVEASAWLGVDSPTVMVLGELGSLGIAAETHLADPGGPGPAPDPATSPPPVEQFIAVCPRTDHGPERDGFDASDGRWYGPVRYAVESARGDAAGHRHGEAYVALYLQGAVVIGPVTAP